MLTIVLREMVYPRSYTTKSAFSNVTKFYASFVILLIHAQQSHCWFDYDYSETQISLSTPEECARTCVDGEPPKYCYYKFHLEFYGTVGPACNVKAQQSQCVFGDGFEKTVTIINRQLPGPLIQVCLGDYIIVDVENAILGQEVTIHWHGIFQNGYQFYDGVPYVTQCPIPSSTTFRYQFGADNSGTHFYHSHVSTHMLDGQYGPLIIKDAPSENPFYNMYDEDEHVIFLSDWLHEFSVERFPGRYRKNIGQTAQNFLINGRGNWTDPDNPNDTTNGNLTEFVVTQNKRYRFRIINSFSTVCIAELSIQNHNMTLIAQDGANVMPKHVDIVITTAGERVDVIVHANQPVGSYYIIVRGLGECKDKRVQQLAVLRYVGGPSTPSRPLPLYDNAPTGIVYNPLDATKCNRNDNSTGVCVNQLESLDQDLEVLVEWPVERHVLDFWFFNYTEYGNRLLFETNSYRSFFVATDRSELVSMFNDITFETPSSPLISDPRSYETICKPNQLSNCTDPCACTQVIHAPLDSVVELLIYDRIPLPDLHHPFHLHGYEFKVLYIGQFADARNISTSDINDILAAHEQRLQRGEYRNPPGKDTVKIPMGGYVIIRFKANNPGWWLIHCHFSWHHLTGMEMVIHVGEEQDLPPVPSGFPTCSNWEPPIQALNDFYSFRYPLNYQYAISGTK
ncbi:uncharacterized protein LOC143372467 isoform X2 [Andrena cerasifolii]|uniref:uncharacterized protein LOC143372467 isoform X2 n=1 Tax=Andrena cerasifolii TaxID=2819439 RepID=UPI0040384870